MGRGRGRPAQYVTGRDGKPIVGLSKEPKSGRYYASHTRPRRYFGHDFDAAVLKFRQWDAQQNGRTLIPVVVPTPKGEKIQLPELPEPELPAHPIPDAEIGTTKIQTYQMMDEQALFDWARIQLLTNPRKFAQRTGIEAIGWINDLKPPPKSALLTEVGYLYFSKKRKITAHWDRKQRNFWDEFCRIVRAKTVREITAEDIDRYHDHVWKEATETARSPTFISHRLSAIRTIMRHALRKGRDTKQVRRVIDLCERFEFPKKNGTDPKLIAREDLHRLLDVCSAKWQAAILLSLNAALYPSELAGVRKSDLDLDKATLIMRRRKTNIVRVASLWQRTVEAIREYQAIKPHDSEFLFVSQNGAPYDANHITRNWRRRREKAGLPKSVTFDLLRDSAYTTAAELGHDLVEAKVLGGHRTGISDHYLMRRPDFVRRACELIEQTYFGESESGETPTASSHGELEQAADLEHTGRLAGEANERT